MNNWKYTDVTCTVAYRVNEDGSCESCLSSILPDGTLIEAADPVAVVVPQAVTNYQGKVTLDYFQMYEEVEAYINLPNTPRAAKLAWATGNFERYGTMTLSIARAFGLSDEMMDTMFVYGKGVE